MAWHREGDRYRCDRHGTSFGLIEQCGSCADDPGDAPDAELVERVDHEALADERWCRTQRDKLIRLADQLTDERTEREAKDRVGYSTVAKLYEGALKYHRAAVEERARRGDKEHDRWLVQQHRELMQRGTAN